MNPAVVLVTGSAPPDFCGVGDYTASLAQALEKAGQRVDLLCHRNWSASGTMIALRKLNRVRDAIVHMQYPTMGYGYSLGPQLCSLVKPCVVTVHEFTLAHNLRKLALIPFTLRSQQFVMTAEAEKRALAHRYPWMDGRIRVIPIGSNIPECRKVIAERKESIVNFGMIMPRKGLEDFIELARLLRERGSKWEMLVIGQIVAGHEAFARKLMELSRPHGVHWVLDRNPGEVSELLSESAIGYFPFPDGASERRGSLKAAFVAGLPCITTKSELTPQDLADVVVVANTPHAAADFAVRLMAAKEERTRLSRIVREFATRFTWEKIAELHMQMYREIGMRSAFRREHERSTIPKT